MTSCPFTTWLALSHWRNIWRYWGGTQEGGRIMRDVLADINQWIAENEKIAIATVIQTWGSSPRGVGSRMGMTSSGKICGSVSGGCVEGGVVETGVEVLENGDGRLLPFWGAG